MENTQALYKCNHRPGGGARRGASEMTYRVVEAMPGTDAYGWYVLVLGTDGKWYNFFGKRPLANQHQIDRAISNLKGAE